MSHDSTPSTSKEPSLPISTSSERSSRPLSKEDDARFQIFLGGSCNPTTWRQSVAIPYLQMNGITYYNPQVDNWTPELVKTERHAKQSAQVLLFVLDEQTRSTVSLVESAFMAGEGKRLVLVIYPFEYDVLSLTDTTNQTTSNITEKHSELTTSSRRSVSPNREKFTQSSTVRSSSTSSTTTISSTIRHARETIKIDGEIITIAEFRELRQARFILQNLVDRRNTAMFSDIPQALDYVTKCLADDKNATEDGTHAMTSIADHHDSDSITCETGKKTPDPNSGDDDYPYDVYLMLDDYDDKDLESLVPLMLRERGLTYSYRPLRDIINHERLHGDKSFLLENNAHALTNNHQEVDKISRLTDTDSKQSARVTLGREISTIQSSRVLLFVITNKCRGLSIMVLASYFMALFRKNVVLCIQYLEEPCSINGEVLSKNAIADYNRGRVYLCDYASKTQVPVFETIGEAIDFCSRRCATHNIKD